MQTGRIIGISMYEWYGDQLLPLKINDFSGQFFGDDKAIGNLTGKTRVPKSRKRLRRRLLAHYLNYFRPCNKARIRESLQYRTDAKEMVAVAMRGIDRSQVLAARRDP